MMSFVGIFAAYISRINAFAVSNSAAAMLPLNFRVELAIPSKLIAVFSRSVTKLSTLSASCLLKLALVVDALAFVALGLAISSGWLAVWSLKVYG
jgi:hypothetical protein